MHTVGFVYYLLLWPEQARCHRKWVTSLSLALRLSALVTVSPHRQWKVRRLEPCMLVDRITHHWLWRTPSYDSYQSRSCVSFFLKTGIAATFSSLLSNVRWTALCNLNIRLATCHGSNFAFSFSQRKTVEVYVFSTHTHLSQGHLKKDIIYYDLYAYPVHLHRMVI